MNFLLKYSILIIFCAFIIQCFAEETTEIAEEPSAIADSNPSSNSTTTVDPNLDTTPENIGNSTPNDDDLPEFTDCDTLKQVLSDYTSELSQITWADHTMNCCDGKKFICKDIDGQRYISELDLSYNYLYGNISSHIGNFTNLESLDLHNNKLSGSVPDEFRFLKNLKYLNLNSNNLSGDFPEVIGELSSLQTIDISNNEISGQLPESLNNLGYLETFTAKYNLISGGITDFFSNTPNLTVLDLSLNRLNGEIPKSISELYNLTELYLNNNELNGSLPDSFANLENLEILNINNNLNLTGSVPDMPKYLKTCNFKDTDLCIREDAVCGVDQLPICKNNTSKIILLVVGGIVALLFLSLVAIKIISKIRRRERKEKQDDQELLVSNEINNDFIDEDEFAQLRNGGGNKHIVEVDEDYIFDPKNVNKFIN